MPHLTEKEVRERLDPVCDAFEAAWLRGERPLLTDLLQNAVPEIRSPLFTELLAIELEFRSQGNEIPEPAEYESLYPDFTAEIQAIFREQNGRMEETCRLPKSEADTDDLGRMALDATILSDQGAQTASGNNLPESPQLIGRYKVLRTLGRGGMGEVLFAEDTVLHRPVAIKLPVFSNLNRDELVARFYREARAMAKIRHPNLCPIYEIGEIDGRPFLAMAYIDGETLSEKTKAGLPTSADEAASIVRTLAMAIQAAHEEGVIHRDLKPGNVMIDRKGVPFITDFGLARNDGPDDDGVSTTGTIIGTPAYMSPEQVAGDADAIGPVTDVYAIGVILYELLTGRRPFQGKGLAALGQISSGNSPPAPSTFAAVDKRLESICQKAMAFKPAARFQSAEELAKELEAWQKSGNVSDRPVRRTGFLQAVAAAALAVALLAGYQVINHSNDNGRQENSNIEPSTGLASATSPEISGSPRPELSDAHRLNPILSPDFAWGPIKHLAGEGPNSIDGEDHASISADERTLIFRRKTDSNRGLLQCRRSDRTEPFGPAEPIAGLDEPWSRDAHTPFLSRDGLTLWFSIDKESGQGGTDIWYCQRAGLDEPFGQPVNAGPDVNTGLSELSPFVTADGQTLLFARGEPPVIVQANRDSSGSSFQNVTELGSLRSNWSEFPRLTNDGLAIVLVTSFAKVGQGISVASRRSVNEPFSTPVEVGGALGGFIASGLSLSADDRTLYFSSNRPGGRGGFDLWSMSRIPQSELPADADGSDSMRSTAGDNMWAPAVNLRELSGPEADGSPTFSGDGSFVIFHRPYATGAPYHLWMASRLADGSGYAPPELLGSEVNSPETNTNPRLTSDGLTLVFDSDRPGGEGAQDLWFSTRESLESPWSEARNFGPNVNSSQWDFSPFLSDDGLTLMFSSDRESGYGGSDLWTATRNSKDEDFGVPVNAGAQVNSEGSESQPWVSRDALTLMFRAMRREGLGGFDLWISHRDSVRDEFGPPENAGRAVNSPEDDGHGSLSPDGTRLYFESNRPGGVGQYDIWMTEPATPGTPNQ